MLPQNVNIPLLIELIKFDPSFLDQVSRFQLHSIAVYIFLNHSFLQSSDANDIDESLNGLSSILKSSGLYIESLETNKNDKMKIISNEKDSLKELNNVNDKNFHFFPNFSFNSNFYYWNNTITNFIFKKTENIIMNKIISSDFPNFFPNEFLLEAFATEDDNLIDHCDFDFSFIITIFLYDVDLIVFFTKMISFCDKNLLWIDFLDKIFENSNTFEKLIHFFENLINKRNEDLRIKKIIKNINDKIIDDIVSKIQEYCLDKIKSNYLEYYSQPIVERTMKIRELRRYNNLSKILVLTTKYFNFFNIIEDFYESNIFVEDIKLLKSKLLSFEKEYLFSPQLENIILDPPTLLSCCQMLIQMEKSSYKNIFTLKELSILFNRFLLTCSFLIKQSFGKENFFSKKLGFHIDAIVILSKLSSPKSLTSAFTLKACTIIWLFNHATQDIINSPTIFFIQDTIESILRNSGDILLNGNKLEEFIYYLSEFSRELLNHSNSKDSAFFLKFYCQEENFSILDWIYIIFSHIFTFIKDIPNYIPLLFFKEFNNSLVLKNKSEDIIPSGIFTVLNHLKKLSEENRKTSYSTRIFFAQKFFNYSLSDYIRNVEYRATRILPIIRSVLFIYPKLISNILKLPNELISSQVEKSLYNCVLNSSILIISLIFLSIELSENEIESLFTSISNSLILKCIPTSFIIRINIIISQLSIQDLIISTKDEIIQMLLLICENLDLLDQEVRKFFLKFLYIFISLRQNNQELNSSSNFNRLILFTIKFASKSNDLRSIIKILDNIDDITFLPPHNIIEFFNLNSFIINSDSIQNLSNILKKLSKSQFESIITQESFHNYYYGILKSIFVNESRYDFFSLDEIRNISKTIQEFCSLTELCQNYECFDVIQSIFANIIDLLFIQLKKWIRLGYFSFLGSEMNSNEIFSLITPFANLLKLLVFFSTQLNTCMSDIRIIWIALLLILNQQNKEDIEITILELFIKICDKNPDFCQNFRQGINFLEKKLKKESHFKVKELYMLLFTKLIP